MAGKFLLQIVGITAGKIITSGSGGGSGTVADVVLNNKEKLKVKAHLPVSSSEGIAITNGAGAGNAGPGNTGPGNTGPGNAGAGPGGSSDTADVLVAFCPNETEQKETYSHTVFLSVQKEMDSKQHEHTQVIGINPSIADELMESALEKKLISNVPAIKQYKRNVPMFLQGKVDSSFSFVGICDDDIPFVMEVNNVPYAEYNHGAELHQAYAEAAALEKDEGEAGATATSIFAHEAEPIKIKIMEDNEEEDEHYRSKIAYFPAKNNQNTAELIKRIHELTTIRKESVIRCFLGYVIERTDVERFEFSMYNKEYRQAVKEAIESGVDIVPLMVNWTKEGVAFFVTDEVPMVYPLV